MWWWRRINYVLTRFQGDGEIRSTKLHLQSILCSKINPMTSPSLGHMLPSVSRRTLIRFLPTILLAIISLIALSLLEFSNLEPLPSSHLVNTPHAKLSVKPQHDMAATTIAALKYITIPPRSTHTATIVFSHGLGDTGEGWRPVAHMLASQFPHVKWILPHAPALPVTVSSNDCSVVNTTTCSLTTCSD